MKKAVPILLVLLAGMAFGQKPEDYFGGKVMTSDKAYPMRASSEDAYIQQVKGQSKDHFDEIKNKDKNTSEWHVYYAAFFKSKLNGLEVTVKTFDVTKSEPRLVESYEQYLDKRDQRAIIGDLRMPRGDEESGYDANQKIYLVFESNGQTVASATFFINGEATKHTGKVDFSKDDE
jgi:hypothetical protein